MTIPSNEQLSEVIKEIWSTLLDEKMAEDTNFFQVGGNSIAAIRSLARFGAETGIELPLRAVFDHPTPAQLAAYVRQQHEMEAKISTD